MMGLLMRKCFGCKKEFGLDEKPTLTRLVDVQAPMREDKRNASYMTQLFYCEKCAKTAPGGVGAG